MDEETFQEMARKRLVYHLPSMEEVLTRRDIIFKTVGKLTLKMDLYTPNKQQYGAVRPAVIFVSGGDASADALRTRSIGLYISYGQLLATAGFVGITFDHRGLEGLTQLRETGEDMDDLLAYVRSNSDDFGVDPERICIWSFSAGPVYGLRTAFRNAPPFIRCAIAYYGGMSVLSKAAEPYPPEKEALLQEFSAVHYLREHPASIPPLFVARATIDKPFLNETIDEFVQLAVANNVPLTFMNHPAGMHGFDILNDDQRSREIIQATIEFIKSHLSTDEGEQ